MVSEDPDDWKKTWHLIQDTWDTEDPCPDGALTAFNIDARINGAYIALGLLYGGLDFGRTIEIATRSGQDSDCNPSTAGGILGVMLGYSGIPDGWKSGIPALADKRFDYTQSSLNDICRSTLERALRLVQLAGGTVSDTEVVIPEQAPMAAPLEQWDMGVPVSRLAVTDDAWSFKGSRRGRPHVARQGRAHGRRRCGGGGGAALHGRRAGGCGRHDAGGRARRCLPRRPASSRHRRLRRRAHPRQRRVARLRPGPGPAHARIVTRADADPRSKGTAISIAEAVVYRAR